MNIAFIGAGKVGRSFGYYLKSKGFNVIGYNSKSKASQELAAKETDTHSLTREELLQKGEIIFITTPDSQIEEVCEKLSEEVGFNPGHTVIHMSGGLSSTALESAGKQGASTFSLHPLQSFAKVEKAREELEKTFFTLEGRGEKEKVLSLLSGIGNTYVEIEPEKKALYHGAASIASNYLVALTNIALRLLEDCGFSREKALKFAGSLMAGTMNNIENYDTVEALTGPIARGDNSTVQKHIEVLKKEGYHDIVSIYKLLGQETVDIALKKGLSGDRALELKETLNLPKEEK